MEIPIDRPLIDGRNIRDAATQKVPAANFVVTHNNRRVLLLTCGDANEISVAPHIQAGIRVGQKLTIIAVDDANEIRVLSSTAGGGLTKLNGNWRIGDTYGEGAWLEVVWDGTYWREIGRGNGELNASGVCAYAEGSKTQAINSFAHAEGEGTLASGVRTHAEGGGTDAIGSYSHSEGFSTTALGDFSHAQGNRAIAALYAEHAEAAGYFADQGDCQFSRVIFRSVPAGTTDATLTELFLDGNDDELTILDEYTYACTITVVGRQDTGVDNFMGIYHALIQRTGGGAPALVGAVDIVYENNAGGWGAGGGLPVSILAGATNLEVWVEGLAGHNIRWAATVEMIRVGFAD